MLRKRTRSVNKDQQMGRLALSNSGSQLHVQSDFNNRATTLFSVPRLFVGLNPKGLSETDSVNSPTSPLDFKVFSNIGKAYRSSKTGYNEHSKVGLSIVDSLDDDKKGIGEVIRCSESKNILFGPQVRIKPSNFRVDIDSFKGPMSLPRNFAIPNHCCDSNPSLSKGNSDVIFEIGEAPTESDGFGRFWSCSLDSCVSISTLPGFGRKPNFKSGSESFVLDNLTTQVNSAPQFVGESLTANMIPTSTSNDSSTVAVGSLSASDIELSEEYTCVISRGPNPKMTHIYGEKILGSESTDLANAVKNEGKETLGLQIASDLITPSQFPTDHFLSFCHYCKKKLDKGKDIYIYRGEKAFCSFSCRTEEIMIDEELETVSNESPKSDNKNGQEFFAGGLFDTA